MVLNAKGKEVDKAVVVMDMICELLPKTNDHRIWSNGEEILCETMELAEHIADLVDAFYGDKVALTGYYDGEYIDDFGSEDTNENGFYYVHIA